MRTFLTDMVKVDLVKTAYTAMASGVQKYARAPVVGRFSKTFDNAVEFYDLLNEMHIDLPYGVNFCNDAFSRKGFKDLFGVPYVPFRFMVSHVCRKWVQKNIGRIETAGVGSSFFELLDAALGEMTLEQKKRAIRRGILGLDEKTQDRFIIWMGVNNA